MSKLHNAFKTTRLSIWLLVCALILAATSVYAAGDHPQGLTQAFLPFSGEADFHFAPVVKTRYNLRFPVEAPDLRADPARSPGVRDSGPDSGG